LRRTVFLNEVNKYFLTLIKTTEMRKVSIVLWGIAGGIVKRFLEKYWS
jgi:hypothetical protein